jgi:hypothetical protein
VRLDNFTHGEQKTNMLNSPCARPPGRQTAERNGAQGASRQSVEALRPERGRFLSVGASRLRGRAETECESDSESRHRLEDTPTMELEVTIHDGGTIRRVFAFPDFFRTVEGPVSRYFASGVGSCG